MNRYSLEFESPDLGGWLWWAIAGLVIVEIIRYAAVGRRPASRATRALLVGIVLVGLVAGHMAGVIRFGSSRYLWLCLGLGIFAGLWLLRSYRRMTREVNRRVRIVLLGLRLAEGAVVLLMLLQPVLQNVRVMRERAVLGIVLDDSRSMTVRDVVKGDDKAKPVSRLDAVKAALETNRAVISRAEDELDLHWFEFAGDVREVKAANLSGDGAATALGDAVSISQTLLAQAGRKVAGVIVVSDGRDNFSSRGDPAAVGDAMAAAGVPVYAVGVGSEVPMGQTRSLRARRLDCPARVAVLNRLPVQAEFFAAGLAGTTVNIELLYDGEKVQERRVTPKDVRELLRVDLTHVPNQGGLHRVTVRAKAANLPEGENEASISQFVQVTDDQVRVLYIDRARYERAAIARALEASKDLRVTKEDWNLSSGDVSKPQSALDYRAHDAVLIGDVDRGSFSDASLKELHDLVAVRGRGVAMLGGVRTLGSGEYGKTVLQEVMPVDLAAVGELPGAVRFALTAAGRGHAICQMANDAPSSEAAWTLLPPLAGASRLAGVKPAAEVLLQTPAGEPLLVVHEVGKGRSAVVAFDSTWQWSFGEGKGLEVQRRFWRQLVLWLANRRAQVWVSASKPRYALARLRAGGEEIVLHAGVMEAVGNGNVGEVALSGQLVGPGATSQSSATPQATREVIQWTRTADGFEARVHVDRGGEFRVNVQARAGERPIGEAETAFMVESADIELTDPMADSETLKRMAGRTASIGGGYFTLDQFGALLERIRAGGQMSEITRIRRRRMVDDFAWWWLSVFVLLIGTEWIVRRRVGLV